jgi:uncharacterized protein YyaL (SSP411 family)
MRTTFFSKLIIAIFFTVAASVCAAAEINWQSYSSAAFAKAQKQHRMVLLFGKASWCPWCRRMKSETFTDSTVVSLINQYYVPVMIDIDSDPSIADRYNISVVPANVIMSGNYKVIDSKTGYISAREMASFLRNNAKSGN